MVKLPKGASKFKEVFHLLYVHELKLFKQLLCVLVKKDEMIQQISR